MSEETDNLCGRCMGEVPCGCYSAEAHLGLPFPSEPEVIIDAFREHCNRMHVQIAAALAIDPEDHATKSRDYGRGFADAIRRVREALPKW